MAVLFVWRLYADAAGEGISPADFLTMEVLCLQGRYPWSFFFGEGGREEIGLGFENRITVYESQEEDA